MSILSFVIFPSGDCGEICSPSVELTKWIGTKASFTTKSHPLMYIDKMCALENFKGMCYQAAGDINKLSMAMNQSCLITGPGCSKLG